MCKFCFLFAIFLLLAGPAARAQQVVSLWGGETPAYDRPNGLQEYEADCWQVRCVYQVVDPTLTLYLPARSEAVADGGVAVVVLPGGGYETLAVYHEGYEIASTLAERGITAAVLKYRLPNPASATQPEAVPLSDLRRALALVRHKQAEWGFTAGQVGVLGFSAGSHLATAASVHRSDTPAENPDFSVLVYGVTRLTPENREWLERTLYHRRMTEEEIAEQRVLERIDAQTPPAFLVHALDDDVCHYSESTQYAEALTRLGIEAEIHLFARGGHGFGAGRPGDGTAQWLDLAVNWLDRLGDKQAN
jgi:acetyl esterase/lipase